MIYAIVLSLLIIAAVLFDLLPSKQTNKINGVVYRFFLLIFICVSAFRWKVGGDTINYQDVFENELPPIFRLTDFYATSTKAWEPLFVGLMSISKTVVNKFWFFQLVHAVIVNVIFFSFIKRESKAKFIALTIYFVFQYLYFNMEIMRESLAISVFLLSYTSFKKRKWTKYYLLVIIACFFHVSAVITLTMPFFRGIKMNRRAIILLFLFFLVTQAANTYLVDVLPALLSNDFLVERILTYSLMRFNIIGILYNLTLFCLLPAIVLYTFRKQMLKQFDGMVFFYFVIAIFFLALNGFGRFINYLTPFIIACFSSYVYLMLKNKKDFLARSLIVLLVSVMPLYTKLSYYLTDTSHLVDGTRLYNLWVPYYSIFTKDEYEKRRILYDRYMEEGLEKVIDQIK